VLTSKWAEWKYEEEIRIFSNDEYYSLDTPVRRVLIGCKVSKAMEEVIRSTCHKRSIKVVRIAMSDEGIDDW